MSKYVSVRDGREVKKIPVSNISDLFLDCAILSANVYLTDSTHPDFIPVEGWQNIATDVLPLVPSPKWKSQRLIKGLKYQVWIKECEGTTKAVLVFKGTTFNFRNDWLCNLRWVTMNPVLKNVFSIFLWDYYHQVQALTSLVISATKTKLGNTPVEFISTGHSLGGGLAQQAAYATNDIKKVIAFDPSPVTGYKDIPRKKRVLNEVGIDISRVYQKGEVLSYLRNFIRHFLPLSLFNPSIKEYEFTFLKGSAIKRHNIRNFALRLQSILQKQDTVQQ